MKTKHFISRPLLLTAGLLFSSILPVAAEGTASSAATLHINADTTALPDSSVVSPFLYGIFLEDINFAVDGGMYAQMVKNGSFEYGMLAKNSGKHGYSLSSKDAISFEIVDGSADQSCLNENNPHYAVLTNSSDTLEGIGNKGYLKGFAVNEGENYRFSAYFKGLDGYQGPIELSITDKNDTLIAETSIPQISDEWYQYECTLTPSETTDNALRLWVKTGQGSVAVDMISLFPETTYKNRENGIRSDIGEYLEALHPAFLRFPGGCAVEGTTNMNQYSWKDSIGNGLTFSINGTETTGDVAARPISLDIWHKSQSDPYYMTYGMGFYEYFLLCEDLDCLPVPILNAGMTCPIQSGDGYAVLSEDSAEFQTCIQDALDLVEFCRGDASTTWGAVRIAMGHEEVFPLQYIGIGNEQWQDEYYSHYDRFREAFAAAAKERPELYQDIELILANGPASSDRFAWNAITKNGSDYAGLVDEHYYETPEWFLANTDRYASYDRNSVPVFLGEYAAKSNTMKAALAEAAYMTGLEENGDIVKMACYAPLFGNNKSNQWEPDMIFFSNSSVYGTVNYYVQEMFSNNTVTNVLPAELSTPVDGLYYTAGISGDQQIVLKIVNTSADPCDLTLQLDSMTAASTIECTVLQADQPDAVNNEANPENIIPETTSLESDDNTPVTIPGYSVSILRMKED